MIAAEKLLHARENGTLTILHVVLQPYITAGIIRATIGIEIDVADTLINPQTAFHERISICVYGINKLSVGAVQTHYGRSFGEEWRRRIQSSDASQLQAEVLLQVIPGMASQV